MWELNRKEGSESHSVMPNSLRPHGLYIPWNSPGQNTRVGSGSLLQGIFSTQGSDPGFLHAEWILYQLSHQGSLRLLEWVAYLFSKRSSWPRNWTGVLYIAGGFFTSWAAREAHKEGRVLKNWCFQTLLLEKTLESHLDSKIKPVNHQGNKPWMLIGRTDAGAEAPMFWPPDRNRRLTGTAPDAGKNWRQKEKRVTENEKLYGATNSMDLNLGRLGRWWGTGKPSMVQSTESQRVGHNWATDNNKAKG